MSNPATPDSRTVTAPARGDAGTAKLWGLMAEFERPDQIYAAAERSTSSPSPSAR